MTEKQHWHCSPPCCAVRLSHIPRKRFAGGLQLYQILLDTKLSLRTKTKQCFKYLNINHFSAFFSLLPQLERHISEQCPLTEVTCPYAKAGCPYKVHNMYEV